MEDAVQQTESESRPGLGRDGMEALFPSVAGHIDAMPPAARERFLMKAFLLMADTHGDLEAALRALETAARSGSVEGRGSSQ
jgi:hypothetical protein